MDVYLALVGVASLSIAVIFGNQLERRRSRSLEQEAAGLGFSFAAVAELIEESAINEVASCMQESGCIDSEVMEVMQGTILGRRLLVFNLREYSSLYCCGLPVLRYTAARFPGSRQRCHRPMPRQVARRSRRWRCRPGIRLKIPTLVCGRCYEAEILHER
jgi:hypothetical protein